MRADRSNTISRIVSIGLILFSGAVAAIGQSDSSASPTVRAVEIELLVMSKEGAFVGDINKDELELVIDGKVHPIESVTLTTSPVIYVLAIDNSGSMRSIFTGLMSAAMAMIDENRADDFTALLRFVDRDTIESTPFFTKDPKYLRSQLDKFFIEGGQTALLDAIAASVKTVGGQKGVGDEYRRHVVVFSDGEDRASLTTEKELIELLATQKVRVSFVGLVDELTGERGFVSKAPRERAKGLLESLTRASGGVAVFPKRGSSLVSAAKQISAQIRTAYVVKASSDALVTPSRIEFRLGKGSKRKNLSFYPGPVVTGPTGNMPVGPVAPIK